MRNRSDVAGRSSRARLGPVGLALAALLAAGCTSSEPASEPGSNGSAGEKPGSNGEESGSNECGLVTSEEVTGITSSPIREAKIARRTVERKGEGWAVACMYTDVAEPVGAGFGTTIEVTWPVGGLQGPDAASGEADPFAQPYTKRTPIDGLGDEAYAQVYLADPPHATHIVVEVLAGDRMVRLVQSVDDAESDEQVKAPPDPPVEEVIELTRAAVDRLPIEFVPDDSEGLCARIDTAPAKRLYRGEPIATRSVIDGEQAFCGFAFPEGRLDISRLTGKDAEDAWRFWSVPGQADGPFQLEGAEYYASTNGIVVRDGQVVIRLQRIGGGKLTGDSKAMVNAVVDALG